MGKYDFDKVIDRRNTASLKYDFGMKRKGRDDLLPLWVADMDFQMPDELLAPLKERFGHAIFGYTDPTDDYFRVLNGWFERRHGISVDQASVTIAPGVVYAIATAIAAFTEPLDAVLIQQPVYYPFSELIIKNNRKLVNSELVYDKGRYVIDFDDFEKKISDEDVKLFILCSPHNPVSRVWSEEELKKIADICVRHDVIVVADEIHEDFVYDGYKHIPLASLGEDIKKRTITCTSPSKTFNIAGLQIANIIITDAKLRRTYRKQHNAQGYSQGSTLGLYACKSVYENGDEWLDELLKYLRSNITYVENYLRDNIPDIYPIHMEGTYLMWLDCSGLGLSSQKVEDLFLDKAKLWVDDGRIFGETSSLFERINIACPRATLDEAMIRLKKAITSLDT